MRRDNQITKGRQHHDFLADARGVLGTPVSTGTGIIELLFCVCSLIARAALNKSRTKAPKINAKGPKNGTEKIKYSAVLRSVLWGI